MSVSLQKRKSVNWSEKEKIVLVEGVVKREDVLFGKFKGMVVTAKTKDDAWKDVLKCVNA